MPASDAERPDRPAADRDAATLLAAAQRAANGGEAEAALRDADRAWQAAQANAGRPAQAASAAEALLIRACVELRLQGRFHDAVAHARQAAETFQRAGDRDGESRALGTLAIAASRIACYEMAVDGALLAVKLAEQDAPSRATVMAYHALGVAMYCGKCFEEAANAYQRSIALAQRLDPPLNTFELHSDLASTETMRYLAERGAGTAEPSLELLETQVNLGLAQLERRDGAEPITPASHTNSLLILTQSQTLLLIWRRQLAAAAQRLEQLVALQQSLGRPWLLAAAHWTRAELALQHGDLDTARRRADDTVAVAEAHQHETLAAVGLQVLATICQRQDDFRGAMLALRRLQQREQAARSRSLQGRLDAIERQFEMRAQASQLDRLESDRRLYQRLAMEDGLTGLANRRQLEARAQAALAGPASQAPAVCLLMIDVDRFKQINDTHSHLVGDAVLRGIAGVLDAHTRPADLAARLAGDEFVLLLHEADAAHAGAVALRLQQAVAAHDWHTLAAGLQVGISVGVGTALAGDTLADLLRRADAAMYADKRGRRAAA